MQRRGACDPSAKHFYPCNCVARPPALRPIFGFSQDGAFFSLKQLPSRHDIFIVNRQFLRFSAQVIVSARNINFGKVSSR